MTRSLFILFAKGKVKAFSTNFYRLEAVRIPRWGRQFYQILSFSIPGKRYPSIFIMNTKTATILTYKRHARLCTQSWSLDLDPLTDTRIHCFPPVCLIFFLCCGVSTTIRKMDISSWHVCNPRADNSLSWINRTIP